MPSIQVEILGAEEAFDLAEEFDKAGSGKLRRELARALAAAHADTHEVLRASAIELLPKRNGLAAAIAGSHIDVDINSGGDPSVTVTASHQYDLKGLDNGLNIHPLFGNKRHWYLQRVPRGWFTAPMKRKTHTTEEYVRAAVARFTASI
jgi:hypothetical protein